MNISPYSSIFAFSMEKPELIECLSYLKMDTSGTHDDLRYRLHNVHNYIIRCHKVEIDSTYGQSKSHIDSTSQKMKNYLFSPLYSKKQFIFSSLINMKFFRKLADGNIEKYDMIIDGKRETCTYYKGFWQTSINDLSDHKPCRKDLNYLRQAILQLEAKQLYFNIRYLTDYLILDIIKHCVLCYMKR